MGKGFQKNGVIVLVLTTFGSAINYLCQIIMGRILTVYDFGTINTIFSIMSITSVVGSTLSMLVSKYVAENLAEHNHLEIKKYTYSILTMMILLSIAIATISGLFELYMGRKLLRFLTVIVLLVNLFPIIFQGVFGGWQKFILLGVYTMFVPVFKLLGTLVAGNNVYYIIVSVIIANLISTTIGLIIVHCLMKNYIIKLCSLKNLRYFKYENYYIDSFIVNICMMILMNVDILYLKSFCGSENAGFYSSAIMFGRIIYYCVTALVSVLLPMVAYAEKKERSTQDMFEQTIKMLLFFSIVFLIPVNLFSKFILVKVYGSHYIYAAIFVKWASLISVGTSLNTVLVSYMLAKGNLCFLKKTLLIGIIATFGVICIMKSNMQYVLGSLGGILMLVFCVNYKYLIKNSNNY